MYNGVLHLKVSALEVNHTQISNQVSFYFLKSPLILLTAGMDREAIVNPDPPGNAGSLLPSSRPPGCPRSSLCLGRSPLDETQALRPRQAGPHLQALSPEAESLIRISFLLWLFGGSVADAGGRLAAHTQGLSPRVAGSEPPRLPRAPAACRPGCPSHAVPTTPKPASQRGFERGSLQSPACSGPL